MERRMDSCQLTENYGCGWGGQGQGQAGKIVDSINLQTIVEVGKVPLGVLSGSTG